VRASAILGAMSGEQTNPEGQTWDGSVTFPAGHLYDVAFTERMFRRGDQGPVYFFRPLELLMELGDPKAWALAIGLGWPERGFGSLGSECFGVLGEAGDGQMPVLGWY
jgi:hypothetical protein